MNIDRAHWKISREHWKISCEHSRGSLRGDPLVRFTQTKPQPSWAFPWTSSCTLPCAFSMDPARATRVKPSPRLDYPPGSSRPQLRGESVLLRPGLGGQEVQPSWLGFRPCRASVGEAKPGCFQTGCFPLFSGKVQIVSRTLSGLFLVGAVNRLRKRKRDDREIPRPSPSKSGKSRKNRESPKRTKN